MKKTLLMMTLLFIISSFSIHAQDRERGSVFCSDKKMNSSLMKIEELFSGPVHSFDVLDYKLDLDLYNCFISSYPKSFKGSVIVTFKIDSTLNSISLNAVNTSLVIDSVRLAGVSFSHSKKHLFA